MRLIIICLCLCSGASLIAFSRAGFPEDPLHLLSSLRPTADREAKDQARFAQHAPVEETVGGPIVQYDAPRTAALAESPTVAAPAAEVAAVAPPTATPVPTDKAEPAGEHHSAVAQARPILRTAHTVMKRRLLFVRAAVLPYRAAVRGVKRARWAIGTTRSAPSDADRHEPSNQ